MRWYFIVVLISISSANWLVEHLLMYLIDHLFMCLLVIWTSSKKCLFRSFIHFLIGLFVFLILSCMSCLYILEINPLSVASFANIFSHYEGCLLIFLMVSFTVQKLISLIRPHLIIFIFISLGGGSKNILLWFMSKGIPAYIFL